MKWSYNNVETYYMVSFIEQTIRFDDYVGRKNFKLCLILRGTQEGRLKLKPV
jgi:hypothetical protein